MSLVGRIRPFRASSITVKGAGLPAAISGLDRLLVFPPCSEQGLAAIGDLRDTY